MSSLFILFEFLYYTDLLYIGSRVLMYPDEWKKSPGQRIVSGQVQIDSFSLFLYQSRKVGCITIPDNSDVPAIRAIRALSGITGISGLSGMIRISRGYFVTSSFLFYPSKFYQKQYYFMQYHSSHIPLALSNEIVMIYEMLYSAGLSSCFNYHSIADRECIKPSLLLV